MAQEIEEFAKVLVQEVRDSAIESSDRALNEDHAIGRRWRTAANGSPEAFARVLVPDVVDGVIFYLLHAIDNGILNISFTASNGRTSPLSGPGTEELAGSYMMTGGFRAKYAKERFVDDFADIA